MARWLSRRLDGWPDEGTAKWLSKRLDGWKDDKADGWLDGTTARVIGKIARWKVEWPDKRTAGGLGRLDGREAG